MNSGLLWFDNSEKTLQAKIEGAISYYVKKYGRQPDLCLVHPSMIDAPNGSSFSSDDLTVRPFRPVLPGHIWIGIEDKE